MRKNANQQSLKRYENQQLKKSNKISLSSVIVFDKIDIKIVLDNKYSYILDWIVRSAFTRRKNNIPIIIIGNIEIEFPAIYIMNRFIGTCFRGAKAISHDFYKIRKKKKLLIL